MSGYPQAHRALVDLFGRPDTDEALAPWPMAVARAGLLLEWAQEGRLPAPQIAAGSDGQVLLIFPGQPIERFTVSASGTVTYPAYGQEVVMPFTGLGLVLPQVRAA